MQKIQQVNENYSSYSRFAYSPMGQRQKKQTGGFGAQYYIHDAQGNVLAVYSSSMVMYNISLHVTQQYIYGSSRLGAYNRNQQVFPTVLPPFPFTLSNAFTRGQKHYELSNHLGNVNSVITDRKLQTSTDGIYVPDVKSFTDYYPFGFPMEDRSWQQIAYRYGFNGQENDNEIYGVGNFLNFEFRGYDSRLGRWWSVDPLTAEQPWQSSYLFCSGNPINRVDPTGMLDDESTHTDQDGNVVAVYNDGDNGVYKHSNASLKNFDPNKMSLTTVGAEKMGETEYWDEFVSPETGKTMTNYRIQFGTSFDPIISIMHTGTKDMNLVDIAVASRGGGTLDLKKDYPNVGALLNGKYATSRSAGNFLAGYNAEGGTYLGIGISFKTFQMLAGALHIEESSNKRLSKSQMVDIVLFGIYNSSDFNKFVAPTYGENNYQYRMSKAGWNFGKNK